MLSELTQFEETVTLVNESGIQFMDFGLNLDPRKEPAGLFSHINNSRIARLLQNKKTGEYFHLGPVSDADTALSPDEVKVNERRMTIIEEPDFTVGMEESLKLLNGLWLPAPVFRFLPPERYDEGPINWSRMRLVALMEPDIDGNTHRLTLAFDTRVMTISQGMQYLAPTHEDIKAGASFRIACHDKQTRWFLEQNWVQGWLAEIFTEANKQRPNDWLEEQIAEHRHIAHYLNLLSLLAKPIPEQCSTDVAKIEIPEIKLAANDASDLTQKIPVDLVLDVGNSRTCGILIENHGQAGDGMRFNYTLQMRDLTCPERAYNQTFESRVEFAQASFGKENFSVQSGRHDAFQWPTIARVGVEAARLASQRRGTEGSTGLSSPKRYLWDENSYNHGWRFNCSYVKTDSEPKATAAPFSNKINALGEAFYKIKNEDERLPAFSPKYSRSSLMTFMLAEVLTQALSQMNSPAQRTRQGHTRVPRQLSSITLTVPPGMSQAERSILNDRLQQAIALVWKCMGWHAGDESPHKKVRAGTDAKNTPPKIPLPKVKAEWDEASCGQMVYLYNEVRENFAGHPEEFFNTLARPDKTNREQITLASIDIGGGTTDVVITDYSIERSGENNAGSNVSIRPEQRFRDSFKVAGDDLLLDIIRSFVLPSFTEALKKANVSAPDMALAQLCGSDNLSAQDSVLRQQLNLQVLTPLGLALLKAYEQYDPETTRDVLHHSYADILGSSNISDGVREFVASTVRRSKGQPFSLDAVTLGFDMAAMHRAFLYENVNLTKVLDAICEVIGQYPCDALLITGRPSCLPGVQAYIRMKLPLPPGRIIFMQGYRTGGWYPFHKNGRIDDPKSTASVGAMLCLLSEQRNITNFYFRANLLKPYSTIKHIGVLDENGVLSDSNVLYRDVTTDEGRLKLHDENVEGPQLEVKGTLILGYRQLSIDRWVASPLYRVELTKKGAEKLLRKFGANGADACIKVRFKVEPPNLYMDEDEILSDRLLIDDNLETNVENVQIDKRDINLQLFTLGSTQNSASDYWLDSGNVNPK